MEQMLPAEGQALAATAAAQRTSPAASTEHGRAPAPRTRVGFFAGCIGSVMFEEVNRQAVELLAAAGADVVAPRAQGCCGAIHHHNGAHHPAEELAQAQHRHVPARRTARRSTSSPPTSPAAARCCASTTSCSATTRSTRDRAKEFAPKVRDISEVLAELGLPEMKHPVNETVTYHDACHLAHAQKVTAAAAAAAGADPRPEARPAARERHLLRRRRHVQPHAARRWRPTSPSGSCGTSPRPAPPTCATGNVGCAMQIQSEADARGQRLRVVHPVELLHRAVFGDENGGRNFHGLSLELPHHATPTRSRVLVGSRLGHGFPRAVRPRT